MSCLPMKVVFIRFHESSTIHGPEGFLGHAGDQIGHLWWRILNGELPKKPPKVFTMLIGTNDLTAADCNRNETELLATVPGIQYR